MTQVSAARSLGLRTVSPLGWSSRAILASISLPQSNVSIHRSGRSNVFATNGLLNSILGFRWIHTYQDLVLIRHLISRLEEERDIWRVVAGIPGAHILRRVATGEMR